MKELKKYKHFYYYIDENNNLWVEDMILPKVFIKIGEIRNDSELRQLLDNYARDSQLY